METTHAAASIDPRPSGRALIVHESMFGNTRHVAEHVASGLRTAGWQVDIVDVGTAPSSLSADLDLLVIGTPTHGFSLHRPTVQAAAGGAAATAQLQRVGLLSWLAEVQPTGAWPWLAVYETRVATREWAPDSVARRVVDVALERGFTAVHRPATFLVMDTSGPLAPGEVESAGDWGRSLTASPIPA